MTVYSKNNNTILLKGWRDTTGAKLWIFSLRPKYNHVSSIQPEPPKIPTALNAHDLPSVGALVRYLHTAAGFPVKSTWLTAIRAGNFSTWPGLTYTNASRYCRNCKETSKGHLTQAKQGIRPTKTSPPTLPTPPTGGTTHPKSTRELHPWVKPINTLYTDDTGRFPVRSRSGNQYLMVAYHCDTNAILIEPFQTREDRHRIPAYTRIMNRLKTRGHSIDHQVLDNKASKEYRRHVTDIWTATYQLVPPDVHRRNIFFYL